MNALLRILAWLLAVALVALPVVAVLNGWVGAGHWPLSRLRANGQFERVPAEQLQQALLHPAFPLYLGRRCCPPTLPLCLGVRPGSLQEVLQAEPPQCSGRQSRIRLEADPLEPGTAPQRDVPVSFDPHHRQYGYRSVRELWQKVPDSPETTEHDPFREL